MYYINQKDYPDMLYITRTDIEDSERGKTTTVASSGCGLCSALMAAHKIFGKPVMTLQEAIELSYSVKANYNIGTSYKRFAPAFAEKTGLNLEVTDDPEKLIACLKSGGAAVVHCRANKSEGYVATFTAGGHYVCAADVMPDGRIAVLDPSYKEGKYDIPERKGKVEVKDGYIALCDIKVLIDDSFYTKPRCFYLFSR